MAKKNTVKEEAAAPSPKKKPAKKATATAKAKPKAAKKTGAVTTAKSGTARKAAAKKPARTGRSKKTSPVAATAVFYEEDVRLAAYYRWEKRGRPAGTHEEDWLEAEKLLK